MSGGRADPDANIQKTSCTIRVHCKKKQRKKKEGDRRIKRTKK
jgi:hypothetical protein